jgi:hypothetical protein
MEQVQQEIVPGIDDSSNVIENDILPVEEV